MKEKLKSIDFWFKIVLLLVFGGSFILAIPYPQESKQFPQILAAISFVMTLALLAIDLLRARILAGEIGSVDDTELTVLDAPTRRLRRTRYYQAWTIILVATAAGYLGGFLFSAALLFAGFGIAFGHSADRFRSLAIAVAMTLLVYAVFGRIMGVPLLNGVLW